MKEADNLSGVPNSANNGSDRCDLEGSEVLQ